MVRYSVTTHEYIETGKKQLRSKRETEGEGRLKKRPRPTKEGNGKVNLRQRERI